MRSRPIALLFALSFWMTAVCLAQAPAQSTQSSEPNFTEEQQRQFLLTANVIAHKTSSKGITGTSRLTLSDGQVTHDASFQPVDEHTQEKKFEDGHSELNFVDSYHYNIAGYELAKLVGIDNMVPVYVERTWNGQKGSLSWWVKSRFDEEDRMRQKVEPPNQDAWNKQMYKIRVFDQLIYDTDPNLTNVLVTEDWKIWRIDFSRAFRSLHDLQNPKDLVMCDRQLLDNLRKLDVNELTEKTKGQLTKTEVQAVMARRDKIVAYFDKLVAQKGEGAVLY